MDVRAGTKISPGYAIWIKTATWMPNANKLLPFSALYFFDVISA
jgi:hypothetical protein